MNIYITEKCLSNYLCYRNSKCKKRNVAIVLNAQCFEVSIMMKLFTILSETENKLVFCLPSERDSYYLISFKF